MIENPNRARVTYAPDFSFADMSGEYISSKELLGKTVLLDFWGTWCGPCVLATPTLVNLNRSFSKPPAKDVPAAFIMLGISSDKKEDEQKLRDYVAKNNMNWPQFQRSDAADPPRLRNRRLSDVHRDRWRGHHPRSHGRLERLDYRRSASMA